MTQRLEAIKIMKSKINSFAKEKQRLRKECNKSDPSVQSQMATLGNMIRHYYAAIYIIMENNFERSVRDFCRGSRSHINKAFVTTIIKIHYPFFDFDADGWSNENK